MATVLIAPGTGGSELYSPPSFFGLGPQLRVWLNYAILTAGAWRWLALNPDGRSSSFPGVGQLAAGWLLPTYYGLIEQWLSQRGWLVRGAQLFWPGVVESDAVALAEQIRGLAGEAPIHCLGHSRGGLVLRRALQILQGTGDLALVGRCAGLGVPHQGSWAAASLLGGFDRSEQNLGLLISLGPGSSLFSPLYQQLQAVVRTWPVSYELLPAPGAVGVPAASVAAVYDPAQWAAGGASVSAAWLAAASARWATSLPVPAAAQWIDVIGVGLNTPDQLISAGPPTDAGDYSYSAAGDGVVPARWATQPGRLSITTPTAHSSLVQDGRVFAALDSYLRVGLSQSITLAGDLLV